MFCQMLFWSCWPHLTIFAKHNYTATKKMMKNLLSEDWGFDHGYMCMECEKHTTKCWPHGEVVIINFKQMLGLCFPRLGHIWSLLCQGAAGRGRCSVWFWRVYKRANFAVMSENKNCSVIIYAYVALAETLAVFFVIKIQKHTRSLHRY